MEVQRKKKRSYIKKAGIKEMDKIKALIRRQGGSHKFFEKECRRLARDIYVKGRKESKKKR